MKPYVPKPIQTLAKKAQIPNSTGGFVFRGTQPQGMEMYKC